MAIRRPAPGQRLDPLAVYLAAIARIPLLTKDDEQRLGRTMAAGRQAAGALAAGAARSAEHRQELEGIMVETIHTGRMIRLPIKAGKAAATVQKAHHLLEMQLARTPTTAELAEEVAMSPEQVVTILGYPRDPMSLSDPLGGEDLELSGMVADPRAELAFEEAMSALRPIALSRLVSTLNDREQEVIRLLRPPGEPWTLHQVGKHLRLSKERVRQVESAAMEKLRRRIEIKGSRRPTQRVIGRRWARVRRRST